MDCVTKNIDINSTQARANGGNSSKAKPQRPSICVGMEALKHRLTPQQLLECQTIINRLLIAVVLAAPQPQPSQGGRQDRIIKATPSPPLNGISSRARPTTASRGPATSLALDTTAASRFFLPGRRLQSQALFLVSLSHRTSIGVAKPRFVRFRGFFRIRSSDTLSRNPIR